MHGKLFADNSWLATFVAAVATKCTVFMSSGFASAHRQFAKALETAHRMASEGAHLSGREASFRVVNRFKTEPMMGRKNYASYYQLVSVTERAKAEKEWRQRAPRIFVAADLPQRFNDVE